PRQRLSHAYRPEPERPPRSSSKCCHTLQTANGYTAIALHDHWSGCQHNYDTLSRAIRQCEKSKSGLVNEYNDDTLCDPDPASWTGAQYQRQWTNARWLRDVLDPQVAREGPDALHSDEILTLDELLRTLVEADDIDLQTIRQSRMHLAICDVAGKGTRWPKKVIEKADAVKEKWESRFGPLAAVGTPLYDPGGRLHGVCKPEDLSREKLMVTWLKAPGVKLSPAVSRKVGDLGFRPGDWWISPLFAYRDGIIDNMSSAGGIVSDSAGAYAVVMTEADEVAGSDPEMFQYRARDRDIGRYRLTSGTPESRHPIRILRSHTLHSFWKPRAGLRYDGLHKVTGWSLKKDPNTHEVVMLIHLKRTPNQVSMGEVLARPWSDEIEDYAEYKRLRQLARDEKPPLKPAVTVQLDGRVDEVLEFGEECEEGEDDIESVYAAAYLAGECEDKVDGSGDACTFQIGCMGRSM
ncbi:unnamed protein product, partial [Lecanosticta acicola]